MILRQRHVLLSNGHCIGCSDHRDGQDWVHVLIDMLVYQHQHMTHDDKETNLERYWNCMFHSRWHFCSWWRHQMKTFSALLALCAGNSAPVSGEFPSQRPVTRSFDVFFDLGLNKPLSKQLWGWWFETPSRSLWRHCNVLYIGYREHKTKWCNNEAIGN